MELQFQMSQLVSLAIGTPEVGAVNFNLLQRILLEMLKMMDLDSATVTFTPEELSKLGDTLKPAVIEGDDNKIIEKTQSLVSSKKSGFHQCLIDPQKMDKLFEEITQLKFDIEGLTGKVKTIEGSTVTTPFQEMRKSLSQIDGLQDKVKNLENILENFKDLTIKEDEKSISQKLELLETTITSHKEQLSKINDILEEKLPHISDQFMDLQEEMGILNEKFKIASNNIGLSKKSTAGSQISMTSDQATSSINNIISRISSLQHDLDSMNVVTSSLLEEQEHRQILIHSLIEQIDFVKITKADKTNMEDILAAKADMSQVYRKVSHDHFETKMENLNAKMEDAFTRLDVHEDAWQEGMETLKADIENKIDKEEFSPLKDYVNETLKHCQEIMKTLANERKDTEAAGSNRKIIRDVQCISCDKKRIMRQGNTLENTTPPPALPTTQSVKPFLTYKLDKVRKQQQKLPGKNLLHLEEMFHDAALNQQGKLTESKNSGSSSYHLVNRYVGGSHTVTSPQQRVTRTGNFYETWGPIIKSV